MNKKTIDALIGRAVRINADTTTLKGKPHEWAGAQGRIVDKNPGKLGHYQIAVADGTGYVHSMMLPLNKFELIALDLAAPTLKAADPKAPATEVLELVPEFGMAMLWRDNITPSRTNPRKHFDAVAMQELAESIKIQGLVSPILVRKLPPERLQDSFLDRGQGAGLPTHEIIAGERRWRACGIAGVKKIPVLIRNVPDRDVLELQLVENLKRSDLHPLEESEGYERLREDAGLSAEQIAEKIGKSRSYVYNALKLLDLSAASREAFYAGKLTRSTGELVARHIEQHQAEIIAHIAKPQSYTDEVLSFRDAQDYIHRNFMLKLADAPFKTDDATLLPTAGACKACHKRSGANPNLFSDMKAADTCTDKSCFALKKEAHLERLKAQAQAQGQTLITGKEAKEILPSQHDKPKGYQDLDESFYADGQKTTLRQQLGKGIPDAVLVESPHTKELRAMLPTPVVNQLLKERGLGKQSAQAKEVSETEAKSKAEAKYEKMWRTQAISAIYQAALELSEWTLDSSYVNMYRCACQRMLPTHANTAADFLKAIGKGTQVAPLSAILDLVEVATPCQVDALFKTLIAWEDFAWCAWLPDAKETPYICAIAKLLDVDVEAMKNAAKESLEADIKAVSAKPQNASANPPPKPVQRKAKTTATEAAADIAAALQAVETKPGSVTPDTSDTSDTSDDLYEVAVKVVKDSKKASISTVQKHLKIGYNRAAQLFEKMEAQGIVSVMGADGQRTILEML